jgi:hypothetical protein
MVRLGPQVHVGLKLTSLVMLVDLARNDVNRVCDPLSTRVDRLMVVQKVNAFCDENCLVKVKLRMHSLTLVVFPCAASRL